jgi:hypothetical protein|eukprot:21264-Pelagococcus_subviridis.AAC.1
MIQIRGRGRRTTTTTRGPDGGCAHVHAEPRAGDAQRRPRRLPAAHDARASAAMPRSRARSEPVVVVVDRVPTARRADLNLLTACAFNSPAARFQHLIAFPFN